MVNILAVYPKSPIGYWSFDWALKIAGRKSAFPPCSLLTIAGMLPDEYNIKILDENVEELKDEHISQSDVVLTSSMVIHKNSLEKVIERCNELKVPVISGGPLPTQYHKRIKGFATHFLGEAEEGFDEVLEEVLREGYKPKNKLFDKRRKFSSLDKTPKQRFDLIKDHFKDYILMPIQTTRGCPEHCTFCNIPSLYGNKTRLKNEDRILEELQFLYDLGWKESIMIVDDNIVGNQEKIIPLLKKIEMWQKENNYPFSFITQGSLRMYDNPSLMEAMYRSGFDQVFFGLESPSPESLKFMGAQKNLQSKGNPDNKSMLEKIKHIQAKYFKAQAGFILGFDTDPDDIVYLMKKFIQDSRISVAMVGPLGVLPDTPDWERYNKEGRLLEDIMYSSDTGVFNRQLSYIPMDKNGNNIDPNIILNRNREILEFINSPKAYFERTLEYIKNRERKPLSKGKIDFSKIKSIFRSFYYQGIKSDYTKTYLKFLWRVIKNDFYDVPSALTYAAHGHHIITVNQQSLKVDDVNLLLEEACSNKNSLAYNNLIDKAKSIYRGLLKEFKPQVKNRSLVEEEIAYN